MKTKTLEVSLHEVIDVNLEGFLDLLEELWMADYEDGKRGILGNITYRVAGVNPLNDNAIVLTVTGEEECMPDDEDSDY